MAHLIVNVETTLHPAEETVSRRRLIHSRRPMATFPWDDPEAPWDGLRPKPVPLIELLSPDDPTET